MKDQLGSLWQFSISIYRNRSFSATCLSLQDQFGFDVNLILFALFAGAHGCRIGPDQFRRLDEEVGPWRKNVVYPLRAVRRWLKQTKQPIEGSESLRRVILKTEIEAERWQQEAMNTIIPIRDGDPDPSIAAYNLLEYVAVLHVPRNVVMQDLATLLAHSIPALSIRRATEILAHNSKQLETGDIQE